MIITCKNCKKKFFQKNKDFKFVEKNVECENCRQNSLFKSEIEYSNNNLTEFREKINHLEEKINLNKKENDDAIQLDENLNKKDILLNGNNKILEELQKKIKELDEANKKIKFYQDENVRLSSQLKDVEKKYEIINHNFNKNEKEKNVIFRQIQELNTSLIKNNIIGTPFLKNKNDEIIANSTILKDIKKDNLKEIKQTDKIDDLNVLVKNIFGK